MSTPTTELARRTLSADDVHAKLFTANRKGLVPAAEVEAFRDQVAGTIRAMAHDYDTLARELAAARERADYLADQTPPAAATRMLELAEQTAEQTVAEAKQRAEQIEQDAAGRCQAIEQRIAELTAFEQRTRTRLLDYHEARARELRESDPTPAPAGA